MASTKIEWATHVWNPLLGCTRVSAGCEHCYAERVAHRFRDVASSPLRGLTTERGRWNGTIHARDELLATPLHWRKPRRVFVNSMSDLFHQAVPEEFIDRVFAVMALSHWHTFIVLTKRADRMLDYLTRREEVCDPWIDAASRLLDSLSGQRLDSRVHDRMLDEDEGIGSPLANVHLGVSVEDQATADERIPLLLQAPAEVRIVSYEPALGPVDFDELWGERRVYRGDRASGYLDVVPWIDQVIVGGESGPGARQCAVDWIRSTVWACKDAGVACFVKQLGANVIDRNDAGFDGCEPESWPVEIEERDAVEHDLDGYRNDYQGAPVRVRLRDRKGGDPAEWPEDLRVREFPEVRA